MTTKLPPQTHAVLAETPPVCVVVSRYNAPITDRLLEGAQRVYVARGGKPGELLVVRAPGAYELPMLALAVAETGDFAGVLALGCLIKGETSHDRYIAEAVANGLMEASMRVGVPMAFGVLTVDTPEQAEARAGGAHGNKGEESMHALLDTIAAMDELWGSEVGELMDEVEDVIAEAARRIAPKGAGSGGKPGSRRTRGGGKS